MHKKVISIIIIYYKAKKELFSCLDSIVESKPKIAYEIIVVDNDEKKTIGKDLGKYQDLVYIKSPGNIGYSKGNNFGARYAKGEYLFFLNPDTEVFLNTIDDLVNFLKRNEGVGIVAPLLLDRGGKPYQQGALELTPLRGIFALSFLNRIFPNNPITKKYWLKDWDFKNVKEVDVVPGTAFVIHRDLFRKVGCFDKKFFLYFEEFDLCNRLKKLGYKIYILPLAKVKHIWGASTKKAKFDVEKVFRKSRFYYFRKHYGLIQAFVVELFARLDSIQITLLTILALGTFLRFYRIQEFMPFIGDHGWFYLSARDMILTGETPLVGITSSHTWLHQGPLWTYMLAFALKLFNFYPISGAYLTSVLGVITIWLIYKVGSSMFSKNVGLIAALLYATSPLVVIHAPTPYHTSPIPLFTLLFIYLLFRWVKGDYYFFPLIIFFLAILYNLELATAILWFILLPILIFGIWKKKDWLLKILNKKILFLTTIAIAIPMLPILIYDVKNGFPQTIGFILWIGYKILVFLGYSPLRVEASSTSFQSIISFLALHYQQLIFIKSEAIAFTIFVLSFSFLSINTFLFIKRKNYEASIVVLCLIISISTLGVYVTKTLSEAYLPILFPSIVLLTAVFFAKMLHVRSLYMPAVLAIVSIALSNSYFLIEKGYSPSFAKKLSIAKRIVKEANGEKYNLIGRGEGSQFSSFTANYEYLTWWLGNEPSKQTEVLRFIVQENSKGVFLKKEIHK